MSEADERFTDIFHAGTSRQSTVLAFRDVIRQGLPHARAAVHKRWRQFAHELLHDPQYDELFTDKEKVKEVEGGTDGLGKMMAESQLTKYQAAVDAASLVFAHSVLDGLVMDYCRLTAFLAPDRWAEYVQERKVSISDVTSKPTQELLKEKIDALLGELARESLLRKCDRLFEVCRPPRDFVGVNEYTYDRDRLKALDETRHNVIHGSADLEPVREIDEQVWFLLQTVWFFMSMVNKTFGPRLDPSYWMRKAQAPKTPA